MTGSDTLKVLCKKHGHSGTVTLTVKFPDGTSHTDKLDITKFRLRERFIEACCAEREGILPADLRDELDAIAATYNREAGGHADEASGGTDGLDEEEDGSTASLLVRMALKGYRLGRTLKNESFAVPLSGSHVTRSLHDSGAGSLRAELARRFWEVYDCVANSSALTDALQVLEGLGMDADPEEVHLRVARHEGNVVLDLGDEKGQVVVVTPQDWKVVTESPVLFRRTQLTGVLPMPRRGGSLDELANIINVSDESRPLAQGYLVASLIADMKHPVLMMGGPKGSGKSTGAEAMARVVDPGPAVLRTPPRDVEEWALNASGSWFVVIDNVSRISEWWSDALCRAATGDGLVRRRLFTSEQLSVLSFLRVVVLTSIDAGALRDDFGDRVLLVDLLRIPKKKREYDAELWARFREAHSRILGALLDLTVRVLQEMPRVHLTERMRMADFHRLLAAVDRVLGTQSVELYVGQRTRVAEEVVEADPVAEAVQAFVEREVEWVGTSTELLRQITEDKPPRGWPRTARALSGCLRRVIDALGELGIEVVPPSTSNRAPGKARERLFRLRLMAGSPPPTVRTVRPSENKHEDPPEDDSGRTVRSDGPPDRPTENGEGEPAEVQFGRSDGSDGTPAHPQEEEVEWTG